LSSYQTLYLDDYQDDRLFLQEVQTVVGSDRPVFITFDTYHPLETAWLLFYSGEHVVLLDDAASLREKQRSASEEAFLLARKRDEQDLAQLGSCEVILQSKRTRGERSPGDRRTLFCIRRPDSDASQR
jgi:hypothetical protein